MVRNKLYSSWVHRINVDPDVFGGAKPLTVSVV